MKVASFPGKWCFLIAALGIIGCGGKEIYQVKGKVVYEDGADVSVLAKAMVVFDPADEDGPKVSARGEVQPDGSFQMSTYKEGDGVVPGKYRVALAPPPFLGGRGKARPQLLDPIYQDYETSGLEITVTGPVTDYSVKVKKP